MAGSSKRHSRETNYPTMCPIAVIAYCKQTYPDPNPSLRETKGLVQAHHEGVLVNGLLSTGHTAYFAINQDHHPRSGPLTVNWALPHQTLSKKMFHRLTYSPV